jgi:hypothetical protein
MARDSSNSVSAFFAPILAERIFIVTRADFL